MISQFGVFLFRGPRPKTCADLQKLKFIDIVRIEEGFRDFFYNDVYENEIPKDFGINRSDFRLSNFFPPTENQVKNIISLLNFLEHHGQKTYLHCFSGVDRTGYIAAVFRMFFQGWSYEDAYTEWVKLGRHWWLDWWKYSLKKWELK